MACASRVKIKQQKGEGGGSYGRQAWQRQQGKAGQIPVVVGDQAHSPSDTSETAPPSGQVQEPVAICHLCRKTFHGRYQKYNLKRHMSIHAGEKPFSCPFCHHRTNQKYNMQQHLLVCRRRPAHEQPPPPSVAPWTQNPNNSCTSAGDKAGVGCGVGSRTRSIEEKKTLYRTKRQGEAVSCLSGSCQPVEHALFYRRTPDDSSTSQDAAGLGFLTESLASPQDSQFQQQSSTVQKVAAERRDSTQGHAFHKMSTMAQETGPLTRQAAREKAALSERVHEDSVDDNPFSPFTEFLNVRQDVIAEETGHDGYVHQP
ncbi:Zinc finger protein 536 [Portunus trituberculatus]|uniref:Zinc finger protein 536 n=1 Tax=Portunus trituberculatus TaxID=210409 RepID=A0A5B7CN91_PORTR|nr:Zinc finger protein 536 [Portunus trituberculatus]